MYSLEQLRLFVTVVEQGSFSAAARRLGRAQSAVSQGIANLEIDLGATLFDRRTRTPTLTPRGERLLGHARAVLQQASELERAARALSQDQETELVLAVDEAVLVPNIEPVLAEFAQRFPATALELHAVASPDVVALVERGRAQLGLMFADPSLPREVEPCFLGDLPFVVVVRPDHPLTALDSVGVADLIGHRQLVVKSYGGEGLAPLPPVSASLWSANNFYLLRELARQGLGWAYVPTHLVESELAQGTLARLSVRFDHKPWRAPVDRVLAKGGQPGPALAWLAQAVQGCYR
ncbi:LysR family transcriptional regulator [Ferrimonas balearica]|uniref:LysR family transcriptional regulator n=1 Tax=Ferrimonas balearica TaxID=44012 RepID=UPI001C9A2B74|nr:LysR family transcriptional regulator [Ferrimonas balearica]MBY5992383.1 LysR family transcriptional regulator [Ferrimonas balearica]